MYDYIGLSGWARSGKDTVGEILVAHYGYGSIAYADALRGFLMAQDPWVPRDDQTACTPLGLVIKQYGWQGYKNSPYAGNIRTLIQRTGTDAGRKTLYEDVWVDATIRKARLMDTKVVITDVRFPNEADAIKSLPGNNAIWRITRPGVGPANDHPSETSMDDYEFDAYIDNNSTIETLSLQLKGFLVD